MTIHVSGTGRRSLSDINVTPMIDVLLVLLVIFMLAQPLLQRSLDVQLPVEREEATARAAPIVLEIDARGRFTLNTRPIAARRLEEELRAVYRDRPDQVLFVKAAGEVAYQDVIAAMDAARGAGVEVLGAVLPPEGSAAGVLPPEGSAAGAR